MKAIIKGKWFVIVAWIAVVVGLFLVAPNMADLVREKGQVAVPDEYTSSLASDIMDDVQKQEGNGDVTQVALVFHDDEKLTAHEIDEAEKAIRALEKNKEELGITEILTHFNNEELKSQLVSKDGKSILASVSLNWNDREASEVNDALYETIEDADVEHYYTSGWMIDEDLTTSSQEGLKKTEGITVVFILVVLLLVFRSLIAPIIPLLTVGISYLAAQSIVAILIDNVDFPVSNYSQIFLVAVLFGIGTDYCILLLSRFKEEMAIRESTTEAIVETYKNAGRTVFFSGLAVMIGFAAIGFSQFKLYQSASAVAVGVAMLLIALFTVVPFFMAVLGRKIFWPSKGKTGHGDSKVWTLAGKFSLTRPIYALLVVAAVCVPFLATYDGDLSFNSLDEISGDVRSIKAFNAIADSFGPGESMPTQIVLKNDERMDSAEYIELAEEISQEVKKVDLVDSVRSVTRPTGEPIEQFFVSNQAGELGDGIGQGKDGLEQISDGLHKAGSELASSEPKLESAVDGINGLITGTDQIESGLNQLQTNLAKIENGIRKGSAGSDQLQKGLEDAKAGAEQLLASYKQLLAGYEKAGQSLGSLSTEYDKIGSGLSAVSKSLNEIDFQALEEKYDGLEDEPDYLKLKQSVGEIKKLSAGLNQLNDGLDQLSGGIDQANAGFDKAIGGQQQLIDGLEKLIDGIEQQQAGLEKLADGQGQIVDAVPSLANGVARVNNGQEQLLDGFSALDGQLSQLTGGLNKSADGLDQVSEGLGSAQDYLSGLSSTQDMDGFYLPKEALESDEFEQAMDAYMSEDRKVMTLDVTFEANPYSNEAIEQVDEIEAAVERATDGTKLENAVVAIGGITSTNADLKTMSASDYSRTVVLMLVGISMILIFLFRSIIMPIYIIGSLILTYYTTMAMNEVLFVDILGYVGISWAVPFFAFVILVALGVDYSIFLMDRFNEYKDISVADAMYLAMKRMGTVIISAVVILGGTFVAMMPSGMLSLIQIAAIILTGLLLYAFVILPLLIPVLVKNLGQANWWPFKRNTN